MANGLVQSCRMSWRSCWLINPTALPLLQHSGKVWTTCDWKSIFCPHPVDSFRKSPNGADLGDGIYPSQTNHLIQSPEDLNICDDLSVRKYTVNISHCLHGEKVSCQVWQPIQVELQRPDDSLLEEPLSSIHFQESKLLGCGEHSTGLRTATFAGWMAEDWPKMCSI